jgi:hypothetical protein
VLLANFNGANGAISYTAETGQSATFFGTAQLSTAQKILGPSSLLLNGSTDYLTFPDSDNWPFGVNNFTIECWIRFAVLPNNTFGCFLSQIQDSNNRWYFAYYNPDVGSKYILMLMNYGGASIVFSQGNATLSANTWYHIVFNRINDTGKIFIAGNELSYISNTVSGDIGNLASPLYIGVYGNPTPLYYLNGYIDTIRITKGLARYTRNFRVPNREQ